MTFALVTYQTMDVDSGSYGTKQWAMVPDIYLPSLLDWLKVSDEHRVLQVTRDWSGKLFGETFLLPPDNWPLADQCKKYRTMVDVVNNSR